MKTIFWDVDTQNDFMHKNGALYVPDAEIIIPNIALLTELASIKGIPILGSVDRHFGTEEYKAREGELAKWGGPFPDHCMENTCGQLKISETIKPRYQLNATIGTQWACGIYYIQHLSDSMGIADQLSWAYNVDKTCGALEKMSEAELYFSPTYFEKQSYDVFSNPAADYIVKLAKAHLGEINAVVYGVATDYCVKAAVLGLQKRGLQCYVVEDAIKGVAEGTTKKALEEMAKEGARFIKTKDVKHLIE